MAPPEDPELQDPRALRVCREPWDLPVSPDQLVAPASQVPQACQEIKEAQVHRDNQDHRDLLASLGPAEIEGLLELKEQLETEVQQGNLVLLDNRDHRVLLATQVQQDQQAH